MENKKTNNVILEVAAIVILAPIVIGAVYTVTAAATGMAKSIIKKSRDHKTIKKGLKDGSIIEINGEYYYAEVQLVKEA